MVLPVDRRGPKGEIKKGPVENLFDFVPLPPLRNQGGFIWLGSYCRPGVGRERPRGFSRKANERLPKHGMQARDRATEI